MSKLRDNPPVFDAEFDAAAERDLRPYVVFTQLKGDGPYVYAGWLDASDDAMALAFAREHYGQDQECVHLWAIPRDAIAGTEDEHAPRGGEPAGRYRVFAQDGPNDELRSTVTVEAADAASALEVAQRVSGHDAASHLWVVPETRIAATRDDEVIWRYTDQTYRLARGYSKAVRAKWEKVRERKALAEYEKDDLTETF